MKLHKAQREILGLNIIRFFSAVLVVGYHFGFMFWLPDVPAGRIMQLPRLAGDQLPAVWFGFIGVQIFFVISGFVISYSAERSNAFEFFRDRFVRLAPCLWICATLSLFIYFIFAIDGPIFRSYLKEITFYPFGPWLDIVVWTLGVEISFYACIFVLLSMGRFAQIGYLAAYLGVASLLYQAFSIGMHCDVLAWTGDCSGWRREWRTGELTLLDHGSFFSVGIFLWLWLVKGRPVSHLWWVLPAAIACVVQIVGCYGHAYRAGHLVGYHGPYSPWLPVMMWAVGVLAIVASVRFNAEIKAACGDRMSRFIRLIGLSTYPLYLVHVVSAGVIVWALYKIGVGLTVAIWSAGFAVVALSFVIVLAFEPPLKFLLRRLLNQAGTALSASIPRLNFLFVPATAVVQERPQERSRSHFSGAGF
jgi:peptidoglycan/LPS O-acetylase OafA/YrhL